MKLRFTKSVGRLRAKSLPLLAGLILSPLMVMGADPIDIFTTLVTGSDYGLSVPQVDAINFVNITTWDIYTDAPYKTADTLNYTNKGWMYGEVGWDFALNPSSAGVRGLSASFFNADGAVIEAFDNYVANPERLGDQNFNYEYPMSQLWVSATNLVNNGSLIGDSAGEIRLTGVNMDLSLGSVEIGGIAESGGRGSSIMGDTNFWPAAAIYDEYWGVSNVTVNTSTVWDGTVARSPAFQVTYLYLDGFCGLTNGPAARIPAFIPALADSTNIFGPFTNIVYTNSDGVTTGTSSVPAQIFRQAVFVAVNDTDITAADRFMPVINATTGLPDATNLFRTVTVRLTSPSGDALYLVDTLASSTNRGLLLNEGPPDTDPTTSCTDPTYRPANYNLEGIADFGGSPGAGPPAANFLYDSSFTNFIIVAGSGGYSAYVDDLVSHPYGSAVANLPGRIIIDATNLNLSGTTISSQGAEITVHAGNLIDSAGATVSCQNLSYNLGSTNGYFNLTNLAGNSPIPGAFHGIIDAFSALWTNGYVTLIPNYAPVVITVGTNSVTNWVLTPITNTTAVNVHVLLLDASGISTTELMTVQDLVLHSTNAPYDITVSDPANVVNTLLFDGQSLTLLTNLTLSGILQSWTYANAPTLRYFTNNGTLTVPGNVDFGSGAPVYITNTTPAIAATVTLSETVTNGNVPVTSTVTIGTNYTYVFVNNIANTVPNQVKIATTFDGSMSNLIAAINHAAGFGTSYSTNTAANTLVMAGLLVNHSFTVTARIAGSSGNSIATTSSTTNLTWNGLSSTSLSGGVDVVTNIEWMAGGACSAFVNNGTIMAGTGDLTIDSDYFQNNGVLYALSEVSVITSIGGVEDASITSQQQDVNFTAGVLELDNSTVTAGRQLNFGVTSSLHDGGPSSGNMLTCNNGFNLPFKPATGDLLGTTIRSTVPDRTVVDHVWAGTNVGPSALGFTNNVAIGKLTLDALGASSSVRFDGASGAGVTNAIYVDHLELLDYASYTNHDAGGNIPALKFNNLIIYYTNATIAGGVSVSSKVNHKNGNCLQWVPPTAFGGSIATTNLVYPDGTTNTLPLALVQSTTLDSNGNGIANASDPTPVFVASQVDFTKTLSNNVMLLTWHGIPSATNLLKYSTDLTIATDGDSSDPALWEGLVTNFVSLSLVPPTGGWPITNTVADPITGTNRYYRVWVYPNSASLGF